MSQILPEKNIYVTGVELYRIFAQGIFEVSKRRLIFSITYLIMAFGFYKADAQITLLHDYQNKYSAPIGIYQGINFREAGFSALFPIANTNGTEYWTLSDRGPNIDDANANPSACRPTYDKMFPFPLFAPKINRIRLNGDSVQILQTITIKRPNGSNATGLMNPTGFGSTALEVVSTDTVQDCSNFNTKTAAKDIWGIDSEGILVDKESNFWVCEEGGPTVWKLSANGVVLNRYTPYGNLPGSQPQDIAVDTVFKYRKNNRGFESIAMTPNGRVYAFIQSPLLFPDAATGNATRVHRILEINPSNNSTRMLAYLNDGIIGASGANQIRLQDWKVGDAAAINDSTFLVLEAAARGTTDIKRMYLVNISQATPVTCGMYNNKSLEGLIDEAGLNSNGIKPVTKTLFMDLLANGWPSVLDKAEGLAIINDSTIAVCNDNDFGAASPGADGIATATNNKSHVLVYALHGNNKIPNYPELLVLPLNLTAFRGSLIDGKTVLNWKTSNEKNINLFEIERSADGVHFIKITSVNSKGTNNNDYQSIDNQPQPGNNYYRLKTVGTEGKVNYGFILLIKVINDIKLNFTVYPNPANEQLIISQSVSSGKMYINIYNHQGQKVYSSTILSQSATISIQHLPRGMYTVQLVSQGKTEVHKILKD